MITSLTLKNFKSIQDQTYFFDQFDLLVGRNNSGKSTVLQALAIWQFCIDEFRRDKRNRRGNKGQQVVLPNFTALPLPEFSLLWREKTDRRYPIENSKKLEYVLIEIRVEWVSEKPDTPELVSNSFGVQLRYGSPQTIYAIPLDGWEYFRELQGDGEKKSSQLPLIAYVPPFSGLEPNEEWRDDGPLRQQIGKAQPGSILRNLLLRVWENRREDWTEIQDIVERWFSVKLKEPQYERGVDTRIVCEYTQGSKSYDIISGGSGFHQVLTLLAFFYGYQPTTILLDEPDAHLHVNLQREILDYFKNKKALQRNIQFLMATHAEEFIQGVDVGQIISLLEKRPKRVEATPAVLTAMSDVSNLEVAQLSELEKPLILYLEGETDERLLRGWAAALNYQEKFSGICIRVMRGGSKDKMKSDGDSHFRGIKQIIPNAERLVLFDYDNEATYHPDPNNPALFEWKRKNIENYLLVPDAWIRAAVQKIGLSESELFSASLIDLIQRFFSEENLMLPSGQIWRSVKANIFKVVDGKKILFENSDSLFQRLKNWDSPVQLASSLEITREDVAASMSPEEIHEDIHHFFARLSAAQSA